MKRYNRDDNNNEPVNDTTVTTATMLTYRHIGSCGSRMLACMQIVPINRPMNRMAFDTSEKQSPVRA